MFREQLWQQPWTFNDDGAVHSQLGDLSDGSLERAFVPFEFLVNRQPKPDPVFQLEFGERRILKKMPVVVKWLKIEFINK